MFNSAVRHRVLLAVAPVILFAMAAPAPAHAAPTAPPVTGSTARSAVAPAPAARPGPAAMLMAEVVIMTNDQRSVVGCGPLDVDLELILASVRQSKYMAITRTFSHLGRGGSTFVGRARAAGYTEPSGENIGWGYETATGVMDAWMASPAHRANILNCAVQSIGTGVAYAADGTTYYTQVFGYR